MKIVETAQRSEAWFEARRGLPTCSRFDSILTPSTAKPSSSQETLINQLIAESIMPPEQGVVRGPMTPEMEHGMKTEAEARCCYELEYATEPVREVGFIISDCGLYGGSPDALVGELGGVEIKCPNPATHIGYYREGVLPKAYKCQVHGYMVVTGRNWWDFFSYCRGFPVFMIRVNRDEFTAALEAELKSFAGKYNAARVQFNLEPIAATKGATS